MITPAQADEALQMARPIIEKQLNRAWLGGCVFGLACGIGLCGGVIWLWGYMS